MIFNATYALFIRTILFLTNNTVVDEIQTNTVSPDVNTHTLYQLEKGEGEAVAGSIRCYSGFGCYSIDFPWTDVSRSVSHFPESPEKVKPKYCLFTRKNPKDCQLLSISDPRSIYKAQLIPSKWVYLIVHGFLDDGDRPWIRNLTMELLHRSDCNVIVVDWGSGSSPPYTQAVANIRLVGTMTALLLNVMSVQVGIETEYCHIIGHGLGAHLAGYVGNILKTKYDKRLGRITGLDPIMPQFSKTDPVVRLDPTDAIFVDVIHSDTTPFVQGGLGMKEPVGHLDFYPNGGSDQPGCNAGISKLISMENGSFYKDEREMFYCDHHRSHELFIESINTKCNFLAVECDSWENFVDGNCFDCQSDKPNETVCAHFGLTSVQPVHTSVLQDWQKTERSYVKLYTITGSRQPYCKALFRVTTFISNSSASIEHGGEEGVFAIEVIGVLGRTEVMELYREQYYKPGSHHKQVVAGSSVGRIKSAVIHWKHRTTFNILTWRFRTPVLHLSYIRLDNLEEKQTLFLCPPESEVINLGRPVKMQPCSIESF